MRASPPKLLESLAGMSSAILVVTVLGACTVDLGPVETPDDAGNSAVPQPLDLFTTTIWKELQEISPTEFPEPVDPTNRVAGDPAAERLGHFLFYDTRLSGNGEISCSSCHRPEEGFGDGERLSTSGVGITARNAPTLLNVGYFEWYFWDGRADSLWSQAMAPLEASHEMGGSRLQLVHLVHDDPDLRRAYESIGAFEPLPDFSDTERFPPVGRPTPDTPESEHHQAWMSMTEEDQITVNRVATNVLKCIAAFELTLISLESPFDQFVQGLREGDEEKFKAIDEPAIRGAELFAGRAQCVGCHAGFMMSDNQFHTVGFPNKPWMLEEDDPGREVGIEEWKTSPLNAAGPYSDDREGKKARRVSLLKNHNGSLGAFRTPTMRNLTVTAPYGSAGHFETLEEVMEFYNELPEDAPVGNRSSDVTTLDLPEDDLEAIIAFLESLEGPGVPESATVQPDTPYLETE